MFNCSLPVFLLLFLSCFLCLFVICMADGASTLPAWYPTVRVVLLHAAQELAFGVKKRKSLLGIVVLTTLLDTTLYRLMFVTYVRDLHLSQCLLPLVATTL